MGKLFEIKGYLIKFYGKYSKYVDKAVQFVMALLTFSMISQNLGFFEILSSPIVTVALSIICTFLPRHMTVVFATVITLFQLCTSSLGIAIVVAVLFLVMYALYFRFAPGKSILLILVPISFMLKIPVAIPILYGLIGSPVCILPITMGTMIYYVIQCVQSYNLLLITAASKTGVMGQVTTFTQQLFSNGEMWCTILAFAICLLLVYSVRRMEVDYSWQIAIVAGALGNLNAMAFGYVIMDIQFSYLSLIIGTIVAVLIALIVQLFVFSVDYSRTEYVQFEDDEYYYYVKAIPKVSVAVPEKTVKRISERQKTGVIDSEQVRKLEEAEKQRVEESEIQRIIDDELNN